MSCYQCLNHADDDVPFPLRSELGPTIQQVKSAYDGVEKWARTERAPFSFQWFAMSPAIRKEPKGVVLIISPFNYPLFTLLGPAV